MNIVFFMASCFVLFLERREFAQYFHHISVAPKFGIFSQLSHLQHTYLVNFCDNKIILFLALFLHLEILV